MMKQEEIVDGRLIQIPLSNLRFSQNYVKRSGVEAKMMIAHLRTMYGDEWREHLQYHPSIDKKIRKLMLKMDLTLPLIVSPLDCAEDLYQVLNGVHTCYALKQRGQDKIDSKLSLPVHKYRDGLLRIEQ